jgi:hypothetical protein
VSDTERFELLPLLLFTTSENVEPAGTVIPGVLSVNVYMFVLVEENDCEELAMSPAMAELRRLTVTVRLVGVKKLPPVRASSRFTVKLPGFSVSAVCNAGESVKVSESLLPLIVIGSCAPVGRVRVSRSGLLQT